MIHSSEIETEIEEVTVDENYGYKGRWTLFKIIAVNSAMAYLFSYLLVTLLNTVSLVIGAWMFGYSVRIKLLKVYFLVKYFEWSHDAVKVIYTLGPGIIMLLGFIALVALHWAREEAGRLKLLFLWFSVHSLNFIVTDILVGNLFTEGLGHVFQWMYLNPTTRLGISVFGLLSIVGMAFFFTQPFVESSNIYFNRLTKDDFPYYITAQVIVPYLAGTILVFSLFGLSMSVLEWFSWVSMALILTIVVVRGNYHQTLYFDTESKKTGISLFLLILSVSMLAIMLFLLGSQHVFNMTSS